MESSLNQAYFDVYSSSKEILRNNQRHLFCNMLDLLSNTCKSTSTVVIGKKLSIDDLSQFWLEDILPLLFDEDVAIQNSAITALEQGLATLSVCEMHRSAQWTGCKNRIISTYAPLIHKQRESRNANWHRIWCLLVRILDREILKGASTINSFLSIVELGFRNPDNTVRAEAFSCWRLLIQLFNTHDQLSSPKRLKLICIPLKSSQSKTPDGAVVKFRVWWYLITCLGRNLEQHFETVVEAFLAFCIGTPITPGVITKYESVRKLALPCIAVLLSRESCHFLQQLLCGHQLENLCQPSPLVDRSVFEKHWKTMANVIVVIIRLLVQEEIVISDTELQLLTKILKNSIEIMLQLDFAPLFENLCREFVLIMPGSFLAVTSAINTIALEGLQLSRSLEDFENYAGVLRPLMKLLIAAKAVTAPDMLQRCVNQVFTWQASLGSKKNWRAASIAAEILLQIEDDEEYESFEVKLLAWRRISQTLLECAKDDEFDCILEKYFDLMDRWILWPLQVYLEFAGHHNISCIDKSFCTIWQELLEIGRLSPERTQYLVGVNDILTKMLAAGHKDLVILNLFDPYATVVMQLNINKNPKQYERLLNLLIDTVKNSMSQKTMEASLSSFLNVFRNLKPNKGFPFFELIKRALGIIMRNATKCDLDMTLFSRWKHTIADVVRSYPDKVAVDQIAGLLNSTDMFVIIPSVWSLNPDKLTERQKERFSEKTNIPALYNDMSQSQDSLIRPWTPKKVVIAKEKQNEIILEGSKGCGAVSKARPDSVCSKDVDQSCVNAPDNEYIEALTSSKMEIRAQRIPYQENAEFKDESSNQTVKNYIANNTDVDPNTDSNNPLEATHPYSSQSTSELNMTLSQEVPNKNQQSVAEVNYFEVQNNDQENRTYLVSDVNVKKHVMGKTLQAEACNNNTDLNSTNTPAEEIQSKEVSPKKVGLKSTLLSSPPDRKLTSNSSSPKLRPKPSAHLTGRGAQLINMIRNKKPDPSQSSQTPVTKTIGTNGRIASTTSAEFEHIMTEFISTPSQAKDMLTFSKRLPSPSASPSTSILKRTLRRDSLEESYLDSPACKKKRVSFHDPPVSVTKEYVKDYEGNKTKPKRCLMMDKVHSNADKSLEARHSLKRRSKLDSITEIERFSLEQRKKYGLNENSLTMESVVTSDISTPYMKSTAIENNLGAGMNNFCPKPGENPLECRDRMMSSNDAFNFVVENYSVEEILEKCLGAEQDSQVKSINVMLKIISRHMKENSKIKSNVLETLSESHSKEFLDHAIRENLVSVVCDRLNLPSVVEYVCEKSKTNAVCRSNLFLKIPEILKHCKQNSELFELIKQLLNNINLTDSSILDLLTALLNMRSKDHSETGNVSEPAIDSSSNL